MSEIDVLFKDISDRYAVERQLGVGGMATVYLARDLKHDRQVAIKVLHTGQGLELGAERFERHQHRGSAFELGQDLSPAAVQGPGAAA